MYAIVTRRTMNLARAGETRQRAETDMFPKFQQAPGFVSFTLVQGEDGVNSAMMIFETKAQLEAFQKSSAGWQDTLNSHGHRLEGQTTGEVIAHIGKGA